MALLALEGVRELKLLIVHRGRARTLSLQRGSAIQLHYSTVIAKWIQESAETGRSGRGDGPGQGQEKQGTWAQQDGPYFSTAFSPSPWRSTASPQHTRRVLTCCVERLRAEGPVLFCSVRTFADAQRRPKFAPALGKVARYKAARREISAPAALPTSCCLRSASQQVPDACPSASRQPSTAPSSSPRAKARR